MPVALLSSICEPTASVLPSALSATAKPNCAPSRGFDALTYAACFHGDAVLELDSDARGGRAAGCWPPPPTAPGPPNTQAGPPIRGCPDTYRPPVPPGRPGPGWS